MIIYVRHIDNNVYYVINYTEVILKGNAFF